MFFPVKKVAEEPEEELTEITQEEIIALQAFENKKFEFKNVIFEKLNFLEQYIKSFSLTFPEEYNKYVACIEKKRKEYDEELQNYNKDVMTFSIDPEQESLRIAEVAMLEQEIKDFVLFTVNYQTYKEKFSKLCIKLNQFYNVLLDTKSSTERIISQLQRAENTLTTLIEEVKQMEFFNKDTRKKEDILNYVIYSDYIIFKSYLRVDNVCTLTEYLENKSKVYLLFGQTDFKNIIFKFAMEELENLQIFVANNFGSDVNSTELLNVSQTLQDELTIFKTLAEEESYFEQFIKFENTINNLSDTSRIAFIIELPESLEDNVISNDKMSVNSLAIAVFKMQDKTIFKVLEKVVTSFKYEISWREFYFLCKVFDVFDEVMRLASDTIFDTISRNFLRVDAKYSFYTDEYIEKNKQKLLNNSKGRKKKYILLFTLDDMNITEVEQNLKNLVLDYYILGNEVYLNHSYFNGFKNLEKNLNTFKII